MKKRAALGVWLHETSGTDLFTVFRREWKNFATSKERERQKARENERARCWMVADGAASIREINSKVNLFDAGVLFKCVYTLDTYIFFSHPVYVYRKWSIRVLFPMKVMIQFQLRIAESRSLSRYPQAKYAWQFLCFIAYSAISFAFYRCILKWKKDSNEKS